MLYLGGIGSPTTRPIPRSSRLRLASVFLSVRETWKRENFRKKRDTLGVFGVPPVVAPEGGSALPSAKPMLT